MSCIRCRPVGTPGRSLCQYVALQGDLRQLAAQLRELLAFGPGQWRIGPATTTFIGLGLPNPGADARFVAAKFLAQLGPTPPSAVETRASTPLVFVSSLTPSTEEDSARAEGATPTPEG